MIKIGGLTTEIRGLRRFIDANNVPTGRLGIEDAFETSIVIESRHMYSLIGYMGTVNQCTIV